MLLNVIVIGGYQYLSSSNTELRIGRFYRAIRYCALFLNVAITSYPVLKKEELLLLQLQKTVYISW